MQYIKRRIQEVKIASMEHIQSEWQKETKEKQELLLF